MYIPLLTREFPVQTRLNPLNKNYSRKRVVSTYFLMYDSRMTVFLRILTIINSFRHKY